MTTLETLTDKQIETLATEAAQHGDAQMVRICKAALKGGRAAKAQCVTAIRNAEAQS